MAGEEPTRPPVLKAHFGVPSWPDRAGPGKLRAAATITPKVTSQRCITGNQLLLFMIFSLQWGLLPPAPAEQPAVNKGYALAFLYLFKIGSWELFYRTNHNLLYR
jgi:hypothetical protein